MMDPNPSFNIPLSLAVGVLLGVLWAVWTKRPRTVWATIVTGIVWIHSPTMMVNTRIFWDGYSGLLGSYLITGITTGILAVAGIRYLLRLRKPQPAA